MPPPVETQRDDRSDVAPSVAASGVPAAAPGERHRPVLLIAMTLAVTVVRRLVAADRSVPHISFDEPTQLAIARTLATGQRWSLFDAPTWQPGFGTLLAPIYLLTDDPTRVYQLALGVNALLGGLAVVPLSLIARRVTGLSARACVVVSGGVCLVPAALSSSTFVWAEPAVTLTFLWTVLALLTYVERPGRSSAAVAIVASVVGVAVHSRLMLLPMVVAVVLALPLVRRRRWIALGGTLAVVVVAVAVVSWYSSWIHDEVWERPDGANSAGAVARRLSDPVAVLDAFAGQIWYQLVASLLVFGVGVLALTSAAASAGSAPSHRPTRRQALVILATITPLFALSALFMSARELRTDMLIYGRYNDAVVAPILVVGLDRLRELATADIRRLGRWIGGPAVVAALLGVVVEIRHGDALRSGDHLLAMIAGLAPLTSADTVHVALVTLLCLAVVGAVVALARVVGPRSRVMAGAVVLLLAIGALRTYDGLSGGLNAESAAGEVTDIRDLVPDGAGIGVRFERSNLYTGYKQRVRAMLYQFYLPELRFETDRGLDDDVGPYVFATRLSDELIGAGAELVWEDPAAPMALWKEPSSAGAP